MLGLAYGVVTSVQNAGLALFPLIIATIYNYSNSTYIPNVEYFFIFLALKGVIIGIYLNFNDYYNGNKILNSPSLSLLLKNNKNNINYNEINYMKSGKSILIMRTYDDLPVTDVESIYISNHN